MIKQLINIIGGFTLRIVLRLFYIFKINHKRVLFVAYEGRQYSCNPKYIFEYLYKNHKEDYELVWCLNDENNLPKQYDNVKIVKHYSLLYFYYALTSKYFISNLAIDPILPKRKQQVFINTWHGSGAYKRVSSNVKLYNKQSDFLMNIPYKWRSKSTSVIISGCEKFTNVMSQDFRISSSKFIPIGLPRNDLFFKENEAITKKVYDYFDISNDKSIVLYAPTFRGNHRNPEKFPIDIDITLLIESLNLKFNKEFVFLKRSHKNLSNTSLDINAVDASDYPDMQELLYASDILITDYSSSMWDFSLTNKPCFIYAPDLEKYQKTRSFYTPVNEWPFSVSINNKQLIKNVECFDNKMYLKQITKHHQDLGSFESGKATELFVKKIFKD